MKQKQLLIILGAAGIILWIYSIYSSIPFAKHLNFNFLKLILENMLTIESLVTPLGFIIVTAGAVINQKIAVAAGGIISLIMPVYAFIKNGSVDNIISLIVILISIAVIVLSLAGKKLKLK